MNKVMLIGRLTKDPEVKQTPSNILVCAFTVAVDRKFKDKDGTRQADFIQCVGWRQVAEIIGKYFFKGSRIGITGSLQSRSYDDNNGIKRHVTEVIIEEIDFLDKKQDTEIQKQDEEIRPIPPKAEPITQEEDDEATLPFDVAGY